MLPDARFSRATRACLVSLSLQERLHALARQFISALVLHVARVTAHPVPRHVVPIARFVQLLPKLDILDRLPVGGFPARASSSRGSKTLCRFSHTRSRCADRHARDVSMLAARQSRPSAPCGCWSTPPHRHAAPCGARRQSGSRPSPRDRDFLRRRRRCRSRHEISQSWAINQAIFAGCADAAMELEPAQILDRVFGADEGVAGCVQPVIGAGQQKA